MLTVSRAGISAMLLEDNVKLSYVHVWLPVLTNIFFVKRLPMFLY